MPLKNDENKPCSGRNSHFIVENQEDILPKETSLPSVVAHPPIKCQILILSSALTNAHTLELHKKYIGNLNAEIEAISFVS